jgi:predicted enzyme related to lactoylglutathione lyase
MEVVKTMQISLAWYSVTDLEKAKEFYGNVLGLKKTFEMPGWAEFSNTPDGVAIGLALNPEAPSPTGGATVVLRVPDLEQARQNLAKHGVNFEGDVKEFPGVVRLGLFRDPFGNRLQAAQVLLEK